MLDDLLQRLTDDERKLVVERLEGELRPGFAIHAQRTWKKSGMLRLFKRKQQPMVLPVTASKLGGVPLLADADQWPRVEGKALQWLGQLNFEEMRPRLPALPERGVLGMWFDPHFYRGRAPIVCRWIPDPGVVPGHAPPPAPPEDAPALTLLFETSLRFERTERLSLESADELEKIAQDQELQDSLFDALYGIGRSGGCGEPEVLPPSLEALEESVGEGALAGRTVFFSISYENEASFSWGTNTFYLHIADDDLAAGALDRTTSAVANA